MLLDILFSLVLQIFGFLLLIQLNQFFFVKLIIIKKNDPPPHPNKTRLCFRSVLCLLCPCARLFNCALWSPAGKGLTSWLSLVVSNCEFVTFPLVSWVGCGTWLYWFLIFAPLLTLNLSSWLFIVKSLFTSKQFESFGNGIKFISVRFSACLAQFCNPLSAPQW